MDLVPGVFSHLPALVGEGMDTGIGIFIFAVLSSSSALLFFLCSVPREGAPVRSGLLLFLYPHQNWIKNIAIRNSVFQSSCFHTNAVFAQNQMLIITEEHGTADCNFTDDGMRVVGRSPVRL